MIWGDIGLLALLTFSQVILPHHRVSCTSLLTRDNSEVSYYNLQPNVRPRLHPNHFRKQNFSGKAQYLEEII